MAELKIISMDEVPVEEVEWLWYPYIPFGKLSIIHGDGGEGKTTLILQLAALLSRGESSPATAPRESRLKLFIRPQRTDSEIQSNHGCLPVMRTVRKLKS